mmetsp:Transcript_11186/g.25440  ORF Transcript_11186/g.25440 Transcript_11186/m.25440 type:complete len:89 (-) Transcript_11186:2-268(-)
MGRDRIDGFVPGEELPATGSAILLLHEAEGRMAETAYEVKSDLIPHRPELRHVTGGVLASVRAAAGATVVMPPTPSLSATTSRRELST